MNDRTTQNGVRRGRVVLPRATRMPPVRRATRTTRVLTTLRLAAFAVVPIAGLLELTLGRQQVAMVPNNDAWRGAAIAARTMFREGDVLLVAPRWAEGHGRSALAGFEVPLESKAAPPSGSVTDVGSNQLPPELLDVRIAARADLDTFRRAIVFSIRGRHDPQTAGWKLISAQKFGPVTLEVLENPRPQKLIRDLADEINEKATVSRIHLTNKAVEPCRWEVEGPQHMPNLFTGPVPPKNRWLCPPFDPHWTTVGTSVFTDLSYAPRRCIAMHPTEMTATTIELPPGMIGHKVVGYVAVDVFSEREKKHAPIHTRISIAGEEVAKGFHKDGDGFVRFEGDSSKFAGQTQPVKLELWAEGGKAYLRLACMTAQLRD